MFQTTTVSRDSISFMEGRAKVSNPYITSMSTLESLDVSRLGNGISLPLTLPEMIMGEYILVNTPRFLARHFEADVTKHEIIIDGQSMQNIYLSVLVDSSDSSGIPRHNINVYVNIIEEIDIDEVAMVTVHQAALFY